MLTRRQALSVLGTTGIGSAMFQSAMAANVKGAESVTTEMVADAERVAGIELSAGQREAAAKSLNEARESLARLSVIQLDNSQLPGMAFVPLSTRNSRPDSRGYEAMASEEPVTDMVFQRDSEEDIAFASIRQLGALLRRRKISSVELTKLYLKRLHKYDPLLKCVVTFMDDLALQQAERADREFKEQKDRGPLQGIPWGIKDVFSYPGYPTTWGAPQYRHRIIDQKAAVAEYLDAAGAVLVAKLATNAFAGGGHLWYRGLTRNPWNARQSASGSSSGPACATAAGLIGFSIATETSWSIQGPSARCGAVGLRPTYGRVSRFGCMQLCWSLDKIGPICRSADDCGLVLGAIHGADPRDPASVDREYVWPSSRDISTIRVGYNADIKNAGDKAEWENLRVLQGLGAKLVPVLLPTLTEDYKLTNELIEGVVRVESAATFEHLTRRGEPKGVQGWPSVWVHGHFLSGVDYIKLNRMRAILMQRFDEMMQTIDIYVGNELAIYENLTGHPKITLPREYEEDDGLTVPRPLFLTGRIYDESTLLALADASQRAYGFVHRPPLDLFLAKKEEILKDEEFPDENKLYLD